MKYLATIFCVVLASFSYQPVYTDENPSQNTPSISSSLSGDGPSVSASISPSSNPSSSGQEKATGQSMNHEMGSDKNRNSESMGNMENIGNIGNMQSQFRRPMPGMPLIGPLRVPNPAAVFMGRDTYDDTMRLIKNLPRNQLKRTFEAGKAFGLVDPNTDSDQLAGQVYSTTANVATAPIRAPFRLLGFGRNIMESMWGNSRGNSQGGYNGYYNGHQIPAHERFAQAGSNFRGGMQQMGQSFGNAGRAVADTARNTASAAVSGTQKVAGSALNAAENAAKGLTGVLSASASSQGPSVSMNTN